MDYRDRARDWATEILADRWLTTRFRLELEGERVVMHKRLGRQIYQATFRIWERAGVAEIQSGQSGPIRVRYPVPLEDLDPSPEAVQLSSSEGAAVRGAAIRAATPQREGYPLEVREIERRAGSRGARCFLVHLEEARPDGALVIELDPLDGERIGYSCPPFCRGSTRSVALGRFEAVKRARAALALPATYWVAHSSLKARARAGRVWVFRFEIRGAPQRGWIKATLNARTGVLCEYSRIVREPASLDPESLTREEAEHTLRNSVRARLGQLAQIGQPAQGAVLRKGKLVTAWLSVVLAPRGVYRATLAEGRVCLRKRVLRGA